VGLHCEGVGVGNPAVLRLGVNAVDLTKRDAVIDVKLFIKKDNETLFFLKGLIEECYVNNK
jgi:hypothetical protein